MRARLLAFPLVAGAIGALPGATGAGAALRHAVAVVVEMGGTTYELCAQEPDGTTGATALADALANAGMRAPRYDPSSGLLCAIDGQPATGCGTHGPGGYAYWAYFHGADGSWSYATDGPGTHRTRPGEVEGWRFEAAGTGRPGDPAPGRAPDAAAVCAAAARQQEPAPTTTPPSTIPPLAAGHEVASTTTEPATTMPTSPVPARSAQRPRATTTSTSGAPRAEQSGSPAGALVGGAVGLGLFVVGGSILWRRRLRP